MTANNNHVVSRPSLYGIDRAKLRAAVRHLRHAEIYLMLDEAIDALSDRKLLKLASRYLDAKTLVTSNSRPESLFEEVKAFEKASLKGEYYQSFMVNSKNCTEMSQGTTAWIAECHRLLGRCIAESKGSPPEDTLQVIEIIAGLLRRIDRDPEDIIFFADEAGSWQVGMDWNKLMPVWFKCLSATSTPEVYPGQVFQIIDEFCSYNRDTHLSTAHSIATPEQRRALAAVAPRKLKKG